MCVIACTIQDIICSLYELRPPYLCHHTHYIWHRVHIICVITSTLLMLSHQLYLRDLIHYIWWHRIYCIKQHIHYICNITATVSVSHPLFPWYHTLCMYDITTTISLTSYTLHKVSHLHFMTSHHIIYDITCSVLVTSLTVYLTFYPLYLCHHNHSIYDL